MFSLLLFGVGAGGPRYLPVKDSFGGGSLLDVIMIGVMEVAGSSMEDSL